MCKQWTGAGVGPTLGLGSAQPRKRIALGLTAQCPSGVWERPAPVHDSSAELLGR